MPHPLENKLAELRRRVRLLVLIRALSAIIGCTVAAAILLGSADYRAQVSGSRLADHPFAGLSGAIAWACYRFFYLPAAVRLPSVDLAAR